MAQFQRKAGGTSEDLRTRLLPKCASNKRFEDVRTGCDHGILPVSQPEVKFLNIAGSRLVLQGGLGNSVKREREVQGCKACPAVWADDNQQDFFIFHRGQVECNPVAVDFVLANVTVPDTGRFYLGGTLVGFLGLPRDTDGTRKSE